MTDTGSKPGDIDAHLNAESGRLLAEMEALIRRARLLLVERRARAVSPATLGDVLYRDGANVLVPPESEWVKLVQATAAGDRHALQALYERAHGAVFLLMTRLAGDRQAAEDLTLDLFHDLPRRAAAFDRGSSVLAWIMNQARARALEQRPASGTRQSLLPAVPSWTEPEWAEVAPGITVKMLARDAERDIISMLVRLVPGGEYPPHEHAGVEELHLLEGELWIDGRKLLPGAFNRAEPGTGDQRVWSETGCMCVLVTSTRDILR